MTVTVVAIESTQHRKLKTAAAKQGVTLKQLVAKFIDEGLQRK